MAQDVIITPASGEINFKDSGTSVALIDIDGSNNLSITNPGGNLSIGDTASDVYIGDGTNNVDIVFEQNGSIRGTGSQTITLGQSGDTISVDGDVLKVLGGSSIQLVTSGGSTRGYIQATDTNDAHLIIATSGGEDICFKDGGLSGTTNMIINGGGNVGIGISPAAKLHVYLTGSAGSFSNIGLFRAGPDSNDSGAEIFVGQQGNSRGLVIRGGRGTGDQALAHFYLNQSGGVIPSATQNHVMTFLQGGYVGIGTTNPGTYKLYVDGPTYIDDYLIADGNIHFETLGQYISFYGDNSRNHSIVANNSLGNAGDDLRINTYGALFINLDSNSNNSSGADFSIGRHGSTGTISDWLLDLSGETGKLRLYKYGSGTHTGTAAYRLLVDSSGNVIEGNLGAGVVDGSGTANYITKWTDTDTIGNSILQDLGYLYQTYSENNSTTWWTDSSSGFVIHNTNTTVGAGPTLKLRGADARITYGENSTNRDTLTFTSRKTEGTAGQEIVFDSDGNVGIGTTTPSSILQIKGDGTLLGSTITVKDSTGATDRFYGGLDANEHGYISLVGNDNTNRVYLNGGSSIDNYILNNLGINTTAPYNHLHVNGNGRINNLIVGNSAANNIPAAALHIKSSGTDAVLRIEDLDSTNQVYDFLCDQGSGLSIIDKGTGSSTNTRLHISTNGNVGIGVTSPSYKLEVNGSFAATTKSFVIDHPTKPGKKLRYASLEGPENGVYVRGKGESNIIELPEYWAELVYEESITVNLVPIGSDSNNNIRAYSVQAIKDNKVYIYTDSHDNVYKYFFTIYGERKDVEKLKVEID